MEKSAGYTISSENPEFATKINDVFGGIDTSSSNLISSDSAIESDEDTSNEQECSPIESTSDDNNCRKCKIKDPAKPDFVLNPSNYTKYDLSDVDLGDNRSNAQIAFQFLDEVADRKRSITDDEGDSCIIGNVLDKHVFRMPEHCVGGDIKKQKKAVEKVKVEESFNKVDLDHLEENVSAAEFRREIEAKLDDSLDRLNPDVNHPPSSNEQFKSFSKKSNRHLRAKTSSDSNE